MTEALRSIAEADAEALSGSEWPPQLESVMSSHAASTSSAHFRKPKLSHVGRRGSRSSLAASPSPPSSEGVSPIAARTEQSLLPSPSNLTQGSSSLSPSRAGSPRGGAARVGFGPSSMHSPLASHAAAAASEADRLILQRQGTERQLQLAVVNSELSRLLAQVPAELHRVRSDCVDFVADGVRFDEARQRARRAIDAALKGALRDDGSGGEGPPVVVGGDAV